MTSELEAAGKSLFVNEVPEMPQPQLFLAGCYSSACCSFHS